MAGQRRITTAEDIKRLGTILSVWAHPDDESFLAAGMLHTAIKNGQRVACVTATKGEAGSQNETKWPTATLGDIRAKELARALKILGIDQHHWLNYPDGGCAAIPAKQAASKLIDIIKQVQPDSILTFGPEGMTGHDDHRSVSSWVSEAVKSAKLPISIYHSVHTPEQYENHLKALDEELNIFFNIDEPPLVSASSCDIYFELPAAVCHCKSRALAAQPSQTEVMLQLFDRKFLESSLAVEAFVRVRS